MLILSFKPLRRKLYYIININNHIHIDIAAR